MQITLYIFAIIGITLLVLFALGWLAQHRRKLHAAKMKAMDKDILLASASLALSTARHDLTTMQGCYASDIDPLPRMGHICAGRGAEVEWSIDNTRTLRLIDRIIDAIGKAGV